MTTSQLTLGNGESLSYYESGQEHLNKKPTLLFIHGNFSNWQWWSETINALTNLPLHIVAVDQRGFGDSTYHHPCSHFNDWAEDLVDFCARKGIKECTAIGWSFGGGVSMKLAEIAPQLATRIILTCSVSHEGIHFYDKEVPSKTREQLRDNPKIKFMQSIIETHNKVAVTQVFQTILLTHIKDYPLEKYDHLIEGSLKQRCYADVMHALANSDITLTSVHAKALMIHGKEDNVIVAESVKATGEYFKNVQMWDNHAHMIPIEDIARYAEEVRKFTD